MIEIQVRDEGLSRALEDRALQMRNTEPLMRKIAGIMHAEVEQNFEAGGRPKWTPLAASTIKQRQKEGTWPGAILNRSGGIGLIGSISDRVSEDSAIVGTNKVYAPILHFGGTINQPARSSLYAQNRNKFQFTKGTGKDAKGGKGKSTFGARIIKIPPRPFLVLSQAGILKIIQKVRDFISGK